MVGISVKRRSILNNDLNNNRTYAMIRFFIGFLLFGGGVYLALQNAAVIPNPSASPAIDLEQAKNLILGGYAMIFIGFVLNIWGFIAATTPKNLEA